jgi:hypothetical protein
MDKDFQAFLKLLNIVLPYHLQDIKLNRISKAAKTLGDGFIKSGKAAIDFEKDMKEFNKLLDSGIKKHNKKEKIKRKIKKKAKIKISKEKGKKKKKAKRKQQKKSRKGNRK